MLIIRKVIRMIRKTVKSHQNIENLKFIKSAFKIPKALNPIEYVFSLLKKNYYHLMLKMKKTSSKS